MKRFVPLTLRIALRSGYQQFKRSMWRLTYLFDPLMPPDNLMFVGGDSSNFKQMGQKWRGTFIKYGLKPTDKVLEVGCGVGRMAIGLTSYITPPGTYDGFDIVGRGIAWCQQSVTSRYPHFRFLHANVHNKQYNPEGTVAPSEFRFPYPDGAYDFVFLTSVFTHMLPTDVIQYLREVSRVLRSGGRCQITYFILTEDSLRRIEARTVSPDRNFIYDFEEYRVINKEVPEAGVAFRGRHFKMVR